MPTVLKIGPYRFYFFSREESRMHIHVSCPDGEAKFWLEPEIELAIHYKLSKIQLKQISALVEEHYEQFRNAWTDYFKNRGN